MNLEQLRAFLAECDSKMRAMIDENPNGLDDVQAEAYTRLDADFDATRSKIEAEEKRQAKEAERSTYMSANQRQPLSAPAATVISDNNRGDEDETAATYRSAFWAMQTRKPLTDLQSRSLNEGVAGEGGYLVPETFVSTIIATLGEKSYMRSIATVSTSTSIENIPIEGTDGANGWIDEEGTYPVSDPSVGQVVMSAHKTGRILKVTEELLQDSVTSIEAYVALKFTKSTIAAEEAAFVSGDGTGKPTGFLVTSTLGKTAASGTAITADEVIDLWGSVDEDYAANGTWKMNRNTLVKIMKLKDGNGDYLVNKGLSGAPSTMLGRPIVINKHMPDVGLSAKAIAFGDFSYYFIKDRTMMSMKRMDELYAATGHVGFRVDKRVDGKLVVADAVKYLQMAAA